jgi:flagellar basal body-associated protein FliL
MNKKVLLILLVFLMVTIIFIGGVAVSVLLDVVDLPFAGKNDAAAEETEVVYKYIMDGKVTTNIKDSKKVVQCKLAFELESADDQLKLQENSYILRDFIIDVLRSYTESDYKKQNIQEIIKMSLVTMIEEKLDVTSIQRIYFEDLITQ